MRVHSAGADENPPATGGADGPEGVGNASGPDGTEGVANASGSDGTAGRVYLALAAVVPVVQFTVGLASAGTLSAGYPEAEEERRETGAALWRMLHWVVLVNVPRAVVLAVPFSYTFATPGRQLARDVGLVALMWSVFYGISNWSASHVLFLVSQLLIWPMLAAQVAMVRGRPKLGDASTSQPLIRLFVFLYGVAYVIAICLAFAVGVYEPAGMTVATLVLSLVALVKDRPETTMLDEYYMLVLVLVSAATPVMTANVVDVLVENLDQSKALESLLTAMCLGAFLFALFHVQLAFARRALPAHCRTVVLFPLQVFEDLYAEFFFANAGVYTSGFFVLLAVQIARTLGRDTGALEEARRLLGNVWRRYRGQDPEPRAEDAVVDWVRIWLQNMVSELSAMFVFVGAIAGEEALGNRTGALTDLGHGDRIALLGAFVVVFLFDVAAHLACFVVLRRAVQTEQARLASKGLGEQRRETVASRRVQSLSIAAEADKLVMGHGVFLLASLLFVGTISLYYVRQLRADVRRF